PSFFFFPSSPPFFFFLLLPPPPSSPLFPYTTLFRSPHVLLDPLGQLAGRRHAAGALRQTLRDALALLEIAVDDHLLLARQRLAEDRKSTRLNSSHLGISYAVFCLKKKKKQI